MTELPTLFKKTTGGKVTQWRIWVTGTPSGAAVIHTEYGLVGGKLQHQMDQVKEGKNASKKNATTPLQQAWLEAEASWTKQKDRKGYGLDPAGTESAAKRAAAPMLAQDFAKYGHKVDWSRAFAQPKLDGCLSAEFEIEFKGGQRVRIADVVAQRMPGAVRAYNVQKKRAQFCEIQDWMTDRPAVTGDSADWFEIELENGATLPPLTGDHRIFLPELQCWRRVDALQPGDKLLYAAE